MGIDFDSWEDYKPSADFVVNPNPNIISLKIDDDIICLDVDIDSFKEIFEYNSEPEYNSDDEVFRFKKSDDYEIDEEAVTLFEATKNEDCFILKKNEKLYFIYVYQSNEYYLLGNNMTFTGWDYNIIVDLSKMTSITKHIR